MFIDVLAHELRGPITPIMVSASISQDLFRNQADKIQQRLINNICDGTHTIVKRLDQLLDLARYARGRFNLSFQLTDMRSLSGSGIPFSAHS